MNLEVAAFLAQDGLTNGAIYVLLSLALVLVFAVTRVIFVPQGEFLSFGALTLAGLQAGKLPGTVWLLLVFGVLAFAFDAFGAMRRGQVRKLVASAPPGSRSGCSYSPRCWLPCPAGCTRTCSAS